MEVFEKYLSAIEKEAHRARMREILNWVKKQFPDMEPKIAWNQPVFTAHGTFIIGFSVSKQHIAVAPEAAGIEEFSADIVAAGYSMSANIFRIRWEQPVDFSLMERMIAYNLKDKEDCTAFWRK